MGSLPVGLTGTTAFFPDILDMCQEAAERAGIDFTSGQALRSAQMSLDLLIKEWSNRGLNLFSTDFQSMLLVPGTNQYTFPADTVDLLWPVMRTFEPNQIDLPMARLDVRDYMNIPNKMYQGRPLQIAVHRIVPPEFFVWPTPDAAMPYTLFYTRLRLLDDTGLPTNSMDMPIRFIPAMIAGLAWRMAMKSSNPMALQRVPLLKQEYQEEFDEARYEDRDRSPIRLVPQEFFF